jgi:hypothetical protein
MATLDDLVATQFERVTLGLDAPGWPSPGFTRFCFVIEHTPGLLPGKVAHADTRRQ